jgi:hypothetical protein
LIAASPVVSFKLVDVVLGSPLQKAYARKSRVQRNKKMRDGEMHALAKGKVEIEEARFGKVREH